MRSSGVSASSSRPNTIASVGHARWHAVTTSPGRIGRFSTSATCSAARIRCTQYVHFSITPRDRTVTDGLYCSDASSVRSYANQLKRRTLYGQLFEQNRVPTQRL